MPWEEGGAASPAARAPAASAAADAAAPAAAAPTPPPAAPPAAPQEASAKKLPNGWREGRKWSKSTIAAEQARRGRKGLPALNNAEMSALLGEPVEASAAPAAAAAPAPRRCCTSCGGCRADRAVPSARKLPSGLRKERSGASRRSPPNRRVVVVKALPALNASEVAALLGEPAAAEAPAAAPSAAAPVAKPVCGGSSAYGGPAIGRHVRLAQR